MFSDHIFLYVELANIDHHTQKQRDYNSNKNKNNKKPSTSTSKMAFERQNGSF